MYCSRFATALVCTALLGACRSFQIPSAVKRQSPQSRNMRRTIRTSGTTTAAGSLVDLTSRQRTGACNAEDEGADGGGKDGDGIDYSADPLTGFLGKFLPSGDNKRKPSPQAKDLVFNVGEEAKRRGMTTAEMVSAVDAGLKLNGWFVTGRVDASLFSESFFFSDPQVSLTGVGKYAEGVAKLFNQEESRCDVISTEADGEDIVVRWRLSGRINLPFNPPIKPYVVTTTFERDSEGLLSTQRDEFAIAGWDILLHAVFPGHPFGADPAPPVQPADV